MSCEPLIIEPLNCGDPLVIELCTGAPGAQGPQGPQGPAGPAGSVTDLTGDISVAQDNVATVTGIQTVPVAATAPTANQILAFNGTQYQPTTFTAGTY
jgi:hypothetical protein